LEVSAVQDASLEIKPETARRLFRWQMLLCFLLLGVAALNNSFTVVADWARSGKHLPLIVALVWEVSSNILWWLLVPLLGWWLSRFPLSRRLWWRSVPAHLLATVPASLLHTVGMVTLRKLAYLSRGTHYDFGAFWENWLYEYRKDFVTYWLLLTLVLAFRFYGLWRDARDQKAEAAPAPVAAASEPAPLPAAARIEPRQDRLVVRRLNREFILDSAQIDRLEADGNYVVVYAEGQCYRLRESLDGLARRLGEHRFARVHRTHVVNIDRVREIQPWDHGDYRILLKDGSFVNFSRRYRTRLEHLFR
jgi:LytTr DNA-binding domain